MHAIDHPAQVDQTPPRPPDKAKERWADIQEDDTETSHAGKFALLTELCPVQNITSSKTAMFKKKRSKRYPGWNYKVLSRLCSDHSPLVGWYDRIPKPTNAPFRFFNMWTSHPDFLEVVKENWKVPIEGHSLFILSQKLKRLKQKLARPNKYVFGNLGTKITEATHNLEALQHQFEQDENEMLAMEIAEQELQVENLLQQEADYWKQRSRTRWDKEVDRSTKSPLTKDIPSGHFIACLVHIWKTRNRVLYDGGNVEKGQGTTRPTHYHVLYDEIGFSPGDLQELVHSLSYVYQRSTTAISIVAPVCYAHLAAAQVSQFMKFDEMSEASSGRGGLTSAGTIPVPELPKLHENVSSSMFFCGDGDWCKCCLFLLGDLQVLIQISGKMRAFPFFVHQVTTLPDEFPDAHSAVNELRLEYVVCIEGVVCSRPVESLNKKMKTGSIELRENARIELQSDLSCRFLVTTGDDAIETTNEERSFETGRLVLSDLPLPYATKLCGLVVRCELVVCDVWWWVGGLRLVWIVGAVCGGGLWCGGVVWLECVFGCRWLWVGCVPGAAMGGCFWRSVLLLHRHRDRPICETYKWLEQPGRSKEHFLKTGALLSIGSSSWICIDH
ncbi:hypothetical protein IFM89_037241 [Coptis chinensis]|uniref:Piwi domain-containing protein n=1 Tax=Coptis chinensis TaxID=261450 RepID=A0A835H8B4_9MAGN|nr:hypothetical protein IFM89_037241 [Coptis chinensis]